MEEFFKAWTLRIAMGVEAAATVIIAVAAFRAALQSFAALGRWHGRARSEDIRFGLGRWLSLGLEFELAADILRTAVAPTWNEIGRLAAIIVIRTALNFFLQKEIEKAEARQPVHEPAVRAPHRWAKSPSPDSMTSITKGLALAIELMSSLVVVGYVVRGLWSLVRARDVTAARLVVAKGAILGLGFKSAAALLKTITLETWRQILFFVVILTLRMLLKRIFTWEEERLRRPQRRLGSHFTSATPAR